MNGSVPDFVVASGVFVATDPATFDPFDVLWEVGSFEPPFPYCCVIAFFACGLIDVNPPASVPGAATSAATETAATPEMIRPRRILYSLRLAFSHERHRYNERLTASDTASPAEPRRRIGRPPVEILRVVPVVVLLALVWLLAWRQNGSLAPRDWLGYALLAGLVLATVVAAGGAVVPGRVALVGLVCMLALAAWAALSLAWSPVPTFGHDEVLLRLFYAVTLALPLLTLADVRQRRVALETYALALGGLALATACMLRFGANPLGRYFEGRLNQPVTYPNGQAALTMLAFWPGLVVAARRRSAPWLRALGLGGATAALGASLLAQSKGSALGLVLSTIVLFAVCPWRLRLLVPTAIALVLDFGAYLPLTAPYRASTRAEETGAIRHAGTTILVLTVIAVVAGAVYAVLDRRLELSERTNRLLERIALGGLAAGVVVGIVALGIVYPHPGRTISQKWHEFNHIPTAAEAARSTSHLTSLGSNRYDFWRVAAHQFVHHPVAGLGSYGWYPTYLRVGRSNETPLRSHSLVMDVLSEEGLVGFALLCGALGSLLYVAARQRRTVAVGALGGSVYFVGHSLVDWIWSVPAVGVAFFTLLGIGAAGLGARALVGRTAVVAGAVTGVAVVLLLGFPWLSSELARHAPSAGSSAASDLRWSRRLDPLSLDPILTENALASTPQAQIAALRRGVDIEPEYASLRYALGKAYLAAGDKARARTELAAAHRLDPHDPAIRAALARAGG